MEIKIIESSYEKTIEKDLERISEDNHFETVFKRLVAACHEIAVMKGWWHPENSPGEQFVMFHSEISEAVEEYRTGRNLTEIYFIEGSNKPEGVPIELADLLIRVFDTCERYNIDILDAIERKMYYNLTRSQRHGGKVI